MASFIIIISFSGSGKTGYADSMVFESFDDSGTDLIIQKGERILLAPADPPSYGFIVDMHSFQGVPQKSLKDWPIVTVDPYLINGSNYLRIRGTN